MFLPFLIIQTLDSDLSYFKLWIVDFIKIIVCKLIKKIKIRAVLTNSVLKEDVERGCELIISFIRIHKNDFR